MKKVSILFAIVFCFVGASCFPYTQYVPVYSRPALQGTGPIVNPGVPAYSSFTPAYPYYGGQPYYYPSYGYGYGSRLGYTHPGYSVPYNHPAYSHPSYSGGGYRSAPMHYSHPAYHGGGYHGGGGGHRR